LSATDSQNRMKIIAHKYNKISAGLGVI